MNDPVIFLAKGKKVYPRIRGKNLAVRYGFPEGYCAIPNKSAYMDDETWAEVMKAVAPGIKKMNVSNVAYTFPILFSIYLTLHICPSKFSADYM